MSTLLQVYKKLCTDGLLPEQRQKDILTALRYLAASYETTPDNLALTTEVEAAYHQRLWAHLTSRDKGHSTIRNSIQGVGQYLKAFHQLNQTPLVPTIKPLTSKVEVTMPAIIGEGFIPLSELAKDLNMHRTHVKAFAIKNGFHVTRIRTRAAGNQETLAVTATDAEALRQLREQWIGAAPLLEQNGKGWFYIVQPLPDMDELRVKLGFATDSQQRLNSYRTICPSATIVKTWPCRFTWEQCAIASVTRIECQQIGQELFHCDDLSRLVERCNEFFALLPNPHG